ncbi:MAG TPA: DUF805 domain-containing protein [Blastocatellia bacterium]|nr:DUF805 domain-containing protein [Blastocatellia bacterium]
MKLRRLLLSFSGRIPRSTFWLAILSLAIVFVVLMVAIESMLGRSASLVLYLPLFWALAAVITKRLKDRGKSPLWFLLVLIPVLGPLWILFETGFLRGTPGENHYGDDPLDYRADYLTVGQ